MLLRLRAAVVSATNRNTDASTEAGNFISARQRLSPGTDAVAVAVWLWLCCGGGGGGGGRCSRGSQHAQPQTAPALCAARQGTRARPTGLGSGAGPGGGGRPGWGGVGWGERRNLAGTRPRAPCAARSLARQCRLRLCGDLTLAGREPAP